jgi:hypothetical protein
MGSAESNLFFLFRKYVDPSHMSIYDNDLACICEIRQVIDNDILGDFDCLPVMAQIWQNASGYSNDILVECQGPGGVRFRSQM